MFEIIFNEKNYRAVAALKKDSKNYIILAKDYQNNLMFFDTEYSKDLMNNIELIKTLESQLNYEDIINIKPNEIRQLDFLDYEYVKYMKLSLLEQLYIYSKYEFGENIRESNLKNKIIVSMKKTLYEYKNKGRLDFKNSLKNLLIEQEKISNIVSYGVEVSNLVEEYKTFIAIKTYEHMNLFELLKEREKINRIINGECSIYELEHSRFYPETLKNRIIPAINIFIQLKEELIMVDIFNLYREPLCLNPFAYNLINDKESKKFRYEKEAKFIYEYGFYEDLGINTQILYNEFKSYNPWEYEYMAEYFYDLCKGYIDELKESEEMILAKKYAKGIYSEVEFYKFLINFIENK